MWTPKFVKTHKEKITTTHTVLHVVYWADASVSHFGYLSPMYAALAVLTIAVHMLQEDQ